MTTTRRAFVAALTGLGLFPTVAKGLRRETAAKTPPAPPPVREWPSIPVTLYDGERVVDTKQVMYGGRHIIVTVHAPTPSAPWRTEDCVFEPTGYSYDIDSTYGNRVVTHIRASYVSGPKYWDTSR